MYGVWYRAVISSCRVASCRPSLSACARASPFLRRFSPPGPICATPAQPSESTTNERDARRTLVGGGELWLRWRKGICCISCCWTEASDRNWTWRGRLRARKLVFRSRSLRREELVTSRLLEGAAGVDAFLSDPSNFLRFRRRRNVETARRRARSARHVDRSSGTSRRAVPNVRARGRQRMDG